MVNANDATFKHYQIAAMCLFSLAGVYLAGLAYVFYVSAAVGEVQRFFSFIFWGGLVVWCGWSVKKGSDAARKWGVFLFGLHLLVGLFYIIFPISIDLTAPLLVVILISSFGLYHALKARVRTHKQ